MTEQLPPANIEAEEAILGSLMFDSKAIAKVEDCLPVRAFYPTSHQIIYQACLALHDKGKKCDYIQLADWLGSRQLLEDVGGTTKLASLLNRTVSGVNIDRYSKLVLEKYRRRQIIIIGHKIVELGYDPYLAIEEVFQEIKESLPEEIYDEPNKKTDSSVSEALYRVSNPNNHSEVIELKADVDNGDLLEDTMASLKVQADKIAKRIWEQKK